MFYGIACFIQVVCVSLIFFFLSVIYVHICFTVVKYRIYTVFYCSKISHKNTWDKTEIKIMFFVNDNNNVQIKEYLRYYSSKWVVHIYYRWFFCEDGFLRV